MKFSSTHSLNSVLGGGDIYIHIFIIFIYLFIYLFIYDNAYTDNMFLSKWSPRNPCVFKSGGQSYPLPHGKGSQHLANYLTWPPTCLLAYVTFRVM